MEGKMQAWLVTCLVVLTIFAAGCAEPEPETVLVTFEIQFENADIAYKYGIVGGKGYGGWRGGYNEVIRDSFYADVGDEVLVSVAGNQFDTRKPSHEVICRIMVNDEEIYLDGDQGTPTEDTQVECRGPVYIPHTPTPRKIFPFGF
jgi:hypothetical protein